MRKNKNDLIQELCKPSGGDGAEGVTPSPDIVLPIQYSEDLNTEEKYVYQGLIEPDTEDPIRKVTKYQWYYTGEQSETQTLELQINKPSEQLNIFNFDQQTNSYSIDEDSLENFAIEVYGPSDDSLRTFRIAEEIRQSIQDSLDKDFYYLVLSHERPVRRIIDSAIPQEFSITTKNEYRFYNERYENSTNNVSTTVLPNYYVFGEKDFYGQEYINIGIANYQGTVESNRQKIIEDFSNLPFNSSTESLISKKMENVLFPHDRMSLYGSYNIESYKEAFPFSITLEFDTGRSVGSISKLLKEKNLNELLLTRIFEKEQETPIDEKLFTIKGNNSPLRIREEIQVLDLGSPLDEGLLLDIDELIGEEFENLCYLDDIEPDSIGLDDFMNEENSFRSVRYISFEDMLDGRSCYSETLYYRVDKYEVDGENIQKIQSFYLSNTDQVEKIKILDTQVKYGKKYRYEIFAYKYAIAYKYSYTSIERELTEAQDSSLLPGDSPVYSGLGQGTLTSPYAEEEQPVTGNVITEINGFKVEIKPTAVIVQMLFGSIEEVVLDKPPMFPEVDIIPYKDNAKEISFFFNPSAVKQKAKDYSLTEDERRQYELIRDSQNLSEEEMITFGSDDKIEKYYIYRTDKHPSSYEDFKNNLRAVAETQTNAITTEYLETLTPNKKYYYMFRSVDIHDHVSPPTAVWEIELVHEDGTTFLLSKVVDFKENKFQKQEKNLRRYIHIKPSLIQSIINEERLQRQEGEDINDILDRVELGAEELEQKVWGKNFKMRIRSKSTNKFTDVVFKFITEK